MQLSQPLLVYPDLQSLLTFIAICWASLPYVSVLYRQSQSWAESFRCAHTSARWKERITSRGLLVTLLLTQPSVWLSLLQGHAADSCSTCSPRPFLQSCFPPGWLPAGIGLFQQRYGTLPLWNFARFLSGHFSSHLRYLWIADIPSSL